MLRKTSLPRDPSSVIHKLSSHYQKLFQTVIEILNRNWNPKPKTLSIFSLNRIDSPFENPCSFTIFEDGHRAEAIGAHRSLRQTSLCCIQCSLTRFRHCRSNLEPFTLRFLWDSRPPQCSSGSSFFTISLRIIYFPLFFSFRFLLLCLFFI